MLYEMIMNLIRYEIMKKFMTIHVSFLIKSRVDYCELLCLVNWTQCFDQTLINLTSEEKKNTKTKQT